MHPMKKFSPSLPVCFNKETVPKPLVMNLLPPGAPWTTVLDNKQTNVSATSSLATPMTHSLSSACPSAPTDLTTNAVPRKEVVPMPLVINLLPPGDKKNGISVTSSLATPMAQSNSNACPSAPIDPTTNAVPSTSEGHVVISTSKLLLVLMVLIKEVHPSLQIA